MYNVIADIIKQQHITILFQPIIDIRLGKPSGYEALCRGPSDSLLHSPFELFHQAEQVNLLAPLELLCIEQAIVHFKLKRLSGRLFVNISPRVLLQAGAAHIAMLCQRANMALEQLVVELTERHPVNRGLDIHNQVIALREYGIAVAIDDLGTGHSGLQLWSMLKPDYVKLDHYFGNGLEQDATKRHFVESLWTLASNLGCQMIVEGVEQMADLAILKRMGLRHCQGYLLGHPSADGKHYPVSQLAEEGLTDRYHKVVRLIQQVPTLTPNTSCGQVLQYFSQQPELNCFPVLDESGRPLGMIRRTRLTAAFAERFGHSLYTRACVYQLMDTQPLLIEQCQSILQASRYLVDNNDDEMDSWFIICENGLYKGMGRIRDMMRCLTDEKLRQAQHANPLTLLPGNLPIQQEIELRLQEQRIGWAAYCDLDNFKPFNDVCGYERGDQMIKLVASLLRKYFGQASDFVGHIGGDDFIVLGERSDWLSSLQAMQLEFSQQSLHYYREEDRLRHYIVSKDRQGIDRQFGLIRLSVGVIAIDHRHQVDFSEVNRQLAQAKHHAKQADAGFWQADMASERNTCLAC